MFGSERGPFVLVLVGATIVGSMATVRHGVVNPPRPWQLREWRYDRGQVALKQGDEMGRFLLGSTVVLLFPRGPVAFSAAWAAGRPIQRGEQMGVPEDRRVPCKPPMAELVTGRPADILMNNRLAMCKEILYTPAHDRVVQAQRTSGAF